MYRALGLHIRLAGIVQGQTAAHTSRVWGSAGRERQEATDTPPIIFQRLLEMLLLSVSVIVSGVWVSAGAEGGPVGQHPTIAGRHAVNRRKSIASPAAAAAAMGILSPRAGLRALALATLLGFVSVLATSSTSSSTALDVSPNNKDDELQKLGPAFHPSSENSLLHRPTPHQSALRHPPSLPSLCGYESFLTAAAPSQPVPRVTASCSSSRHPSTASFRHLHLSLCLPSFVASVEVAVLVSVAATVVVVVVVVAAGRMREIN
ncbi:hypothetical protein O3P69_013276 [Scylla paramamosain]|uniref:Uncharacterized protein n=1 Tax=Scylla paramamosain TaxID=85552 RepID=A0AAW0U0P5_SCYPA